MSIGAGYPFVCGAGIEAASPGWGTAVAMTDRVPILKETLSEQIKMIEDMTLRGHAGHDALDLGEISVSGDIETDIRYTLKSGNFFCGSDLLLSVAMGAAPTFGSSVNTLLHNESPVRPVTFAMNKIVAYWEFVSCMLKGFKISGKTGDPLSASFPLVAHRVLRSGTTNGATQFGNLAANGGKRVLFEDLTFRIGDLDNALAAGDALGINEFSLDFDGNFSDSEFSTPDYGTTVGAGTHGANTTTQSARLTLPPRRNGKRKATLDFTVPRYLSNQLFTWFTAGTPLQIDIGSSIDSAARTFKILIPHLKLESVEGSVDGPAMFPIKCKATILRNGGTTAGSGANGYMTDTPTNKIPEEFEIEIKNSSDGREAAIWS